MTRKMKRRIRTVATYVVVALLFVGVYFALHHPSKRQPQANTAATTNVRPMEFGIAASGRMTLLSDEELQAWVDSLKELGVTWVRYDIMWSHVQHNNSHTYSWWRVDRVVDALNDANIQTLGILTYTPQWARKAECASVSDKCPPADPAQFATFAGEAVKRYAPKGVKHWEIWNEPNHKSFWLPSPNIVAYTELLKQANTAIKAEDPSATVLVGGLTGGGVDSLYPINFLQGIYDNGGGSSFDAIATHLYTTPFPLLSPAASWRYMAATTPSLRSTLDDHGDTHKKIWATEFGAPTNGSGTQYAETDTVQTHIAGDYVSDSYQVKLMQDAVADFSQYDWAGPFFWYTLYDAAQNSTSIHDNFGLIEADGTRKPAFDAYRAVISSYRQTPPITPSLVRPEDSVPLSEIGPPYK